MVSFCGFAPADDPQVLVYVVIDQPHVEDQAHSTFASGVFSQIMQDILPYLNIFPSGDVQVVTPVRPPKGQQAAAGEENGAGGNEEGESGSQTAGGENGTGGGTAQGENGTGSQAAQGENAAGGQSAGEGGDQSAGGESGAGAQSAGGENGTGGETAQGQNGAGGQTAQEGEPPGDGGSGPGGGTVPYDTEESVPREFGEDGSVIPSDLPDRVPGGQTSPE